MSISQVNTTNFYAVGSFVSSVAVALSGIQQGDWFTVYGGQRDATLGTLSVSDNQGNSYTSRVGPITGPGTFGNASGWTAENGNFTTATVTLSDTVSPTDISMSVITFRSTGGTGWTFDISRSGTGTDGTGGATRNTTAGTVAAFTSVGIAATQYVDRTGGAYTAGSGYTLIGTGNNAIVAEWKISSGSTSETAPIVDATADNWIDLFISAIEPGATPFVPPGGGNVDTLTWLVPPTLRRSVWGGKTSGMRFTQVYQHPDLLLPIGLLTTAPGWDKQRYWSKLWNQPLDAGVPPPPAELAGPLLTLCGAGR